MPSTFHNSVRASFRRVLAGPLGEVVEIRQGEAVAPSEQVVFSVNGIFVDGSSFEENRPQLSAECIVSADDFSEAPRREPEEMDQVSRGGKLYIVRRVRRDPSIRRIVLELRYLAEA